ncbi:MAG: GcrA family cell cycle regulator, partial [Caulobacteraceae bacterium]
MGWTDDRVETLKKLWLEGLSASQIAKHLGGVTRNAVIGKVHRLGLSGRAAPSQPARPVFKAPRAPRPIAHQPVQQRRSLEPTAPQLPQLPAIPEEPGSATVLTLGAHMCKWPIGDPSSDSFTFCGRRNNEGPYCIEHARVA